MTREDEIRSASSDHRDWVCCGFIDFVADARRDSFVEGAKWADKTMIEKACEWIQKEVLDDYPGVIWDNIVEDFRKAMEG